jgi:hypothetical protein
MSENREAAEVYMMSRSQVILTATGQVLDISIPAVKICMDVLGVKDQRRCMSKVRAAFYHFLKKEG